MFGPFVQRGKWGEDRREKTQMLSSTLKETSSGNDGCCIPASSQNGLSFGIFLGRSPAASMGSADTIHKSYGLASPTIIIAPLNFDVERRLKPSQMLWWCLPAVACRAWAGWACLCPPLGKQSGKMSICTWKAGYLLTISGKTICYFKAVWMGWAIENGWKPAFSLKILMQCLWWLFDQQGFLTTALQMIF